MLLVRAAGATTATLLVLGLAACTGTTGTGTKPQTIVGRSFAEAEQALPDDAVFLVQDVSPLFNMQPSYTDSQFGSSRWTVVAACADADLLEESSTVEIAIAPSESLTATELSNARNGDYSDSIVCNF